MSLQCVRGPLKSVICLCAQVLEPCKDSKVFKPPNPWVQSILALVAEIYAQDKLKLNLKFEIELLFRNMGIQARPLIDFLMLCRLSASCLGRSVCCSLGKMH